MTMWSGLLSIIFPEQCIGCNKPGTPLCGVCKNAITFSEPTGLPDTAAIFAYDNKIMQAILWQCKYHHKTRAYELLVKAAVPHIIEVIAERIGAEHHSPLMMVPVPQYRSRTLARGYNQSVLTARILARHMPHTKVVPVLKKIKETIPQARLKNRNDRLHNVTGSMHYSKRVDGRDIYIVVDDVTTTGATLREAMRALKEAGAVHVFGLALAHGFRKS